MQRWSSQTRRFRSAPILMVILALVLAACGSSEGEPETEGAATEGAATEGAATEGAATEGTAAGGGEAVTLTWVNWATSEESSRENAEKVIAAFEEANPNITIESVPVGFSDIPNQVITMSAAGNAPDVVQVDAGYSAQLADEGLLAPLDDLTTEDYTSRLMPEIADLARFDGSLYAIPWFAAPFGLWYNRDLMEDAGLDPDSPPATLDEMTSAMETLREAAPNALPFGLDTTIRPFGLTHNWPAIRAQGAEPISDDGQVDADTPEMVAYLEWVQTLLDEGLTQPSKKLGDFRNLAAQGDLLFAFDGPYLGGTMQSINPELTDDQLVETWGVAPFPVGEAGEAFTAPTDHQLAILEASENKEAAWEFISFLAGDEQAIRDYVLPLGGLPPFTDATETFDELSDPISQAYYDEIIPTVVRPPFGAKYAEASEVIMTNVQRVFATDADPASIAADIQSQLEPIYAE